MDFYHHCSQYRKPFKEYTFDKPMVFTVGLFCSCLCSYHPLFLNEHRLILLLTQAKAQVLYLLLSHWVGQWIKPLRVSTAAPCLSSACLRETQKVFLSLAVKVLLTCWLPVTFFAHVNTDNYLKMSSVEFWVLWVRPVCSLWDVFCFEVFFSLFFSPCDYCCLCASLSRRHWTTAVICPSLILDLSLVVRGTSSILQTKMESSPSVHPWVIPSKGFDNFWGCIRNSLIRLLYVDVCRMSQEQLTAVAWMTAHRSDLLGPYQEMALWVAVGITAVHLTHTHPS